MQNRIFFPQAALDEWLGEGAIDLSGTELTIRAEARRYKLEEAVHIVRELTGGTDGPGLIGKVKPRAKLEGMGAEIVESSMVLDDLAYDVVAGWIGEPIGSFEEHAVSEERLRASTGRVRAVTPGQQMEPILPISDEDLLARFLLNTL